VEKANPNIISLSASTPWLSLAQAFDERNNWARVGKPVIGIGPTKYGAAVMLNVSDNVYSTPAFSWGLFKSRLPTPLQYILRHY
jgi:hypothetical protein